MRPAALYVHFPFCLSVCPYCDFVVYARRAAKGTDSQVDRVVQALITEIRLRAVPGSALGSVYLGGGTPSLMTARHVTDLLRAIDAGFGVSADPEITIEINPGSEERGDLAGFHAAGVNRVSIGAQSLDSAELTRLGRRHSPGDVATAVAASRAAGFQNLSVDLLYDVPDQTLPSWRATLRGTLALAPDHVSAYALTLDKPDPSPDLVGVSRGAARWRAHAQSAQDQDRAARMYEIADDELHAAGLPWYEISNWARPGQESRHNSAYWQSRPWTAVGPGAHAFDGEFTRQWNDAALGPYLDALEHHALPPGGVAVSDAAAMAAERTMLELRTRSGTAADPSQPAFVWAASNGLLEAAGTRVRLTRRGRLLSNELFARLMPDAGARADAA